MGKRTMHYAVLSSGVYGKETTPRDAQVWFQVEAAVGFINMIMDALRYFVGRVVLLKISSEWALYAMILKDMFHSIWHFGLKNTELVLAAHTKLFTSSGRDQLRGTHPRLVRFMEILDRFLMFEYGLLQLSTHWLYVYDYYDLVARPTLRAKEHRRYRVAKAKRKKCSHKYSFSHCSCACYL